MGKTLRKIVGSAVGGAVTGLGVAIAGEAIFHDQNFIEALQEPYTYGFAAAFAMGNALYTAIHDRGDSYDC